MFANQCRNYSINDLVIEPVYDNAGNPNRDINSGDYVRHFKGNIYHILGVAIHSETKECLIIYESVTAPEKCVYARPLSMFTGKVDHEKYPDVTQIWRFEKVNIIEKNPSRKDLEIVMTFGRQSEELCSKAISDFMSKNYNSKINSIETWTTNNKSDIYGISPTRNHHIVSGIYSGIKLCPAKNIKDGITIKFGIGDTLLVTVLYGDDIYFIGDNRFVIKNSRDNVYEVFDVITKTQ